MKSLFIILLMVFVGCTSAHKSDHRHPSSDGYDEAAYGDGHGHDHGEEHDMVKMELPDDPIFCDLNGDGSEEDEIRNGQICEIPGMPNTAFSQKPILALGLKKGELILTIDDGPTRGVTTNILNLLDKYGIKATFFLTGNRIRNHASIVRDMYARGHTIGNHTYSHNVKRITSSTIVGEILKAHQEIVDVLGEEPKGRLLFRAPGLAWSSLKARNLNARSSTKRFIGPIHANLGTDAPKADWHCWSKGKSARTCADYYYDVITRKGRGIVLAHDLKSKTYDMLAVLLDRLDRNGGIGSRGVWKFRTLQDNTALAKFDTGGGAAISVTEPMPESPFRSNGYNVRDARYLSSDYDNSRIPFQGGTLLTGHIAKIKIVGSCTPQSGKTTSGFKKIEILEMMPGLPMPSVTTVCVGSGAF